MSNIRLFINGSRFHDRNNREVILHGLNLAADAKFPAHPNQPSQISENFFNGDSVSFVGRPFSIETAHEHFSRLKKWGYNTIRYVFTWEAIEHERPGKYDEEWISSTVEILRLAKGYGFYVFMDPHQDVWSRFSGGSGAPMWTLYACGLDPKTFGVTEAALVQNAYPDPSAFPKMIWATNYQRYACQVLFTIFFAGRDFAPRAILDGKNIQDYLQDHFFGACRRLAQRIHEAGDLEGEVVIGWESLNEPNRGMVGYQDLTVIPAEQKLQKGTSPTAWQAILTGSGRACEIPTWDFGGMGPYKSGSILIDPEGVTAHLPADYDDTYYGWKRDPGWKLGECIWAQHGVWDPDTDNILKKDYFGKHPTTGENIDYEIFTNTYFMHFYREYSKIIRGVHNGCIMFCQPPVLEVPPTLKGGLDDDPNMVFTPHFYDGITLMTKRWNRLWNVDVFGVLRGKYLTPAFAIKVGENAIRNCFRDQLKAIRQEGMDNMGERPCIFSEIGIPYDMDDKYAYKTGNYSSQIAALDANHFAIEGCGGNGLALWVYVANNHTWGDQWNGEDLSIFSEDDQPLPSLSQSLNASTVSLGKNSPSYSRSEASSVTPSTLKQTLSSEEMNASGTLTPRTRLADDTKAGYRAAEAFVRPHPIAVHGKINTYGFILQTCTFTLTLTALSPTEQGAPTEVFLPDWHFPIGSSTAVEVSGGKWEISRVDDVQVFKWWHADGEQKLTVKGKIRKSGAPVGTTDEEEGYLEQCQKTSCCVM
ncbi:glycoside hydrolase [Tothia fuscella]|uniref:Glycoside hydrolase n=1 Tax=Tothia fuscella TaxID=1048955 RepID=A0A9P4NMN8_9PEZI|nr:glycoside hydrolase [Tothia fuscella]